MSNSAHDHHTREQRQKNQPVEQKGSTFFRFMQKNYIFLLKNLVI